MKRRASVVARGPRGDRGAVDGREGERRGQCADQRDAWRGADLGRLGAADRPRIAGIGQRPHRRPAVGEHAQARRECFAEAESIEHRRDVRAGGRERRVGEVERARADERCLQRVGAGDRRCGRAGRHGERGLRRGRSARPTPARTSPLASSESIIASVTIRTSHGAPPRSASRIAPTAPKVGRNGDARGRARSRLQRVDQALDGAGAEDVQRRRQGHARSRFRARVIAPAWRPRP